MSDRPGILFRFELMNALEKLDNTDAGALFLGAMRYGQTGQEPEFEDPLLLFAWALIRPAIDRDGQAYDEKILQKKFAVYVREEKRAGREPLDFEKWKEKAHHPISGDIGSYPNTIANAIHSHTHIQVQEQIQDQGVAAGPPPPARDSRNLIFLDDEQYNALVTDLGEKETSRCIDYLSEYCSTHNKRYHDWPTMIRKAAREQWGLKASGQASTSAADFQPSQERIRQSTEWLDSFLDEQEKKRATSKWNLEAVEL